jgi:ribA/ribD-fused uncharacterized protein
MFTYFWKDKSPFSQWHRSNFTIHGINFNCAEQAMMYFKDKSVADEVLTKTNPRDHKALGRKIKNFNDSTWNLHKRQIVYLVNSNKFHQNEDLFKQLMETNLTVLVEASPYDKIWGIGMTEDHVDISSMNRWKGENILGFILTDLRNDFILQQNKIHFVRFPNYILGQAA